jgi:hypothetical protein
MFTPETSGRPIAEGDISHACSEGVGNIRGAGTRDSIVSGDGRVRRDDVTDSAGKFVRSDVVFYSDAARMT